ncbi:transporter substrate-binding domain-containing protein [Thiotrichales bacterium 19S11-10]|nr:transporter substrate-binding domain-containing protein [Thiotrichales bacterium 19S11-10]
MMMKKLLTIVFAGFLMTTSLYANNQKKLVFATEATYPPFVYMNSNGVMNGFGADMVEALCQQMDRQCKLVNAPWDSLIPSLQIGRFDAIFGGMGITKAREKVVSFTTPYYVNSVTFVVKKDSDFSLDNMEGKTIGVQVGTTFAKYLLAKYSGQVTIKTYQSNMTALMDLKAGRVDAVFLDKPVAVLWLEKKINEGFTSRYTIQDPQFFGIGNGIAVKKSNKALLYSLNQAIEAIKANGTYEKIVNKWFGKS